MADIQIIGAHEGNLKNITLNIPKHKLAVFTGVSGSGKTTLLVDVLFHECQRLYLEALSLEGIHKPGVEKIRGASPAVLITQTESSRNPRSTVGTRTDVYTDLRMIYEKLGVRTCPHCGGTISSADCIEETEKIGNDFYVYMYCSRCGKRMHKITRTDFSFNTKEGACPACEGLGRVHSIRKEAAVDESLSPENGAIRCFEKQYCKYQISVLYRAFLHFGIPAAADTPVCQYSSLQKAIFYNGAGCEEVRKAFGSSAVPKTAAEGRFEGIYPILWRRLAEKKGDIGQLDAWFDTVECPECKGERLGSPGRDVTVNGVRLPELSEYSLEKLCQWVCGLRDSLDTRRLELVEAYLRDIETKLKRYINVGIGYLTLDRQIITLSGGEQQRLKLAAALDSDLSGVIYILDEPTAGLHPKDTEGLIRILKKLRDLGNTVLVIEHDMDVMAAADIIIDIGPGAGRYGGEVVAAGTLTDIRHQNRSVTGRYLLNPPADRHTFRKASGSIHIKHADLFNLKDISTQLPTGCFVSVTGPSGSGKSTLIFEVLAKGRKDTAHNCVTGLEQFDGIVRIEQSALARMKRSNVATYSDVYSEIRSVFARTCEAAEAGLTAKHFSFNTPGGRCENCGGLGYIENNMLFFTNTEIVCPVCHGSRFSEEVLAVKYKGLSIKDVLDLSVEEAAEVFSGHKSILAVLNLLTEVGLQYLQLGQTLTTLSGGEGQRLKLARELIGSGRKRHNLYLMDEPTTGLHPADIEHFLKLLNRLIDGGSTVVVVEHNQQLIRNSDWVIDLGPAGGENGGYVLFEGTPEEMKRSEASVTARYL